MEMELISFVSSWASKEVTKVGMEEAGSSWISTQIWVANLGF
jgi:hypothetical protein